MIKKYSSIRDAHVEVCIYAVVQIYYQNGRI